MATDENALRALFAAQPATGAPAHAGFAAQWKSLAQSEPLLIDSAKQAEADAI